MENNMTLSRAEKLDKIFGTPLFAVLLAIFCNVLWGCAFPFIKMGYRLFEIDPSNTASIFCFAGVRFMLGSLLVLLGSTLLQSRMPTFPKGKVFAECCVLGLWQTTTQYAFYYIAVAMLTGAFRPTGLLDPKVEVRPIEGQIDDLIGEVNKEVSKKHKILITTLTKRMAEDLTEYMKEVGIRVRYLHSDIDTLERARIIRDMRLDVFDVLVGINLLREGLDIPEITLVAILDADKEGFLRSETSLIQTIGRAARNSEGHVIMYADNMTDSMHKAITETNRRRTIQEAYNKEHGITPTTIKKAVRDLIAVSKAVAETEVRLQKDPESMTRKELTKLIAQVEKQMRAAAADLNFEQAAELRDKMIDLKKNLDILDK